MGLLPTQDITVGGPARNLGIFWTHVINPRKVNELRFTAQTIRFGFQPLAATMNNPLFNDPNITIAGLAGATFAGLTANFPQGRAHNVYEYQDAFSWVAGNHSVRVGFDLQHVSVNDTIPFNSRGTIAFTSGGNCATLGLVTCTGLANFLDNDTGPSGSAGKQFGNPSVSFALTQQFYYIEDTWKARPNLTLTYGVRWEYYGTPLNSLPYPAVNNVTAPFDPETLRVSQQPDSNNFGPRFGFAYTPTLFGDDRTVFRGGFGAFYDSLFTNIQDNSASSAPNALGGTLVAPATGRGLSGAIGLVPSVTATLNPLSAVTAVVGNIVNPLIYQWNFDIERRLPGSFLATVAYVGTRGERLFLNEQLNPGINGVRINPNRGSIGVRTNIGNSSYNGLQVKAERRYHNGLLVRGSYTFSKAIDNGSDVFTTSGGSSYSQKLLNAAADRGPSAFDLRHRAVFTWIYTIPSAPNASGATRVPAYLIRNWQVSGTASFQTGMPDTIYFNGYDQNRDLSASNDRPSVGNPLAAINYSAACRTNASCITGVGMLQANGAMVDFNTGAIGSASQFRYIAMPGTNGNLGRNTFFGPGRQDWTLAVTRIFPLPYREGHQLEFRAEAFNPFNHPNAGGGTSIPGVSTNLLDPNFLNVASTYEGGRSLRLWLKYRF
jgi:hypothetical protein